VAAPATGGVVTIGADDEFARIAIRNNRFAQLAGVAVASDNSQLTTGRSPATAAKIPALAPSP
jgi:hypothetical protein